MLKDIVPNIPATYGNYHEPFLGGGAVALQQMEAYDALPVKRLRKFILSDYSSNVIDAWTAVKDYPQETIRVLKTMLGNHCRDHFMEVRHWDRHGLMETKTVAERGARFIYLLQTCFGGVVGETKQGYLKMTPRWLAGNEAGHREYDYENLLAVSALLNRLDVDIRQDSYQTILDYVSYGDFVYLDPPYDPKSDKGETLTTDYVAELPSQEEIRNVINALGSKGAMALMSNSDTQGIRDLYEGWACTRPDYRWSLNSSRKQGQEILVANWRLADRIAKEYETAA